MRVHADENNSALQLLQLSGKISFERLEEGRLGVYEIVKTILTQPPELSEHIRRFSDEFFDECQIRDRRAPCLRTPCQRAETQECQDGEASMQTDTEPAEDGPLFQMVSRCSVLYTAAFSGRGLSFFSSILGLPISSRQPSHHPNSSFMSK